MKTFIEEVAGRLYEKYGDEVSSLTLAMPSKRARLFFAEALKRVAVRPLWEPSYISIDELMCQLSGLRKADRLRLVAELHKVYSKYHKESFEEFYHWGEVLVADFDMLDKYMVDAAQLFANIRDLKDIEADMSYLSAEQIEMINRFWRTLTGEKEGVIEGSATKSSFLTVWRSLGAIYEEFRSNLRALGVGYTGMIYREAVERIDKGLAELPSESRYVFVGFNALSKCEQLLLQYMQRCCHAEFYWDYDNYYMNDNFQEAGLFVRQNLAMFGEESGVSHDNFRKIKSVNVLSTSSNVTQCQSVVGILEEIASQNGGVLDKNTAVVLTDENMLMPLLYALPEEFKQEPDEQEDEENKTGINVTMGYPLRNTLTYSFVERLLALQKNSRVDKSGEPTFYYVDVEGLLTHPYIADISISQYGDLRSEIVKHRIFQVPQSMIATTPLLKVLFRKTEGWRDMSDYLLAVIDELSVATPTGEEGGYRAEFLTVVSDALVKLQNIVEQCDIEVSESIYRSLVRRHLQSERVYGRAVAWSADYGYPRDPKSRF